MMNQEQYMQEYKAKHPVHRSFHTGLWGYDRVLDCLDLNECKYKTEHAAKCARAKDAKDGYEYYLYLSTCTEDDMGV